MDLATNNKNAPLHAAFANALTEGAPLPTDIQYMPPGCHRIRASQGGKPISVEVAVNAATAAVLQTFLAGKLTAAAEGREDRPFFDFNHEDREASAWPTEFYWAGDEPQTGGVRARLDWSDAGKKSVEGRTSDNKTKFFVTLESNPSSNRKRLCIQTEKLHQSQASDPSISRWPPKAFLAAALPMAKTEVAELAPKALAKRKRA
jgi:hypothetical protein